MFNTTEIIWICLFEGSNEWNLFVFVVNSFFNPLTVFCLNEIYSGGMGLHEEDHLDLDLYE